MDGWVEKSFSGIIDPFVLPLITLASIRVGGYMPFSCCQGLARVRSTDYGICLCYSWTIRTVWLGVSSGKCGTLGCHLRSTEQYFSVTKESNCVILPEILGIRLEQPR